MKTMSEYSSAPEDVKIMPRVNDGVTDIRMTQNYIPGSGQGEEATPGTVEEVYFWIPIKEAPTAQEIRTNWEYWWDYGRDWAEEKKMPTTEDRVRTLEANQELIAELLLKLME